MTATGMLNRTILLPFYRRNAGQFLFIFLLFFGIVAPSLLPDYHYHLIIGMLRTPVIFAGVFLAWLAYAEKTALFAASELRRAENQFLTLLNTLPAARLFVFCWLVQWVLLLPISLYAIAVALIAFRGTWLAEGMLVIIYIIGLSLVNTVRSVCLLNNPGVVRRQWLSKIPVPVVRMPVGWALFFARYAIGENKLLLAGIKLFGCGLFWLTMQSVEPDRYDVRMQILVYGMGVFGHGILIYKFRELEENRMLFYRSLPVALPLRFLQYCCLYFVLFIPEVITVYRLMPGLLHYKDGIAMLVTGYGMLLLLNSILFTTPVRTNDYLVIVLCLFLVLYGCVLGGVLLWLGFAVLIAAAVLFRSSYYRYERRL